MRTRTRLTAAALLAATALGFTAPSLPAGADDAVVSVGADSRASRVFSLSGFTPAGGAVNTETFTAPGDTPVIGQFVGGMTTDIVWYTPGAGGDELWSGQGDLGFSHSAVSISGTYSPLVGTFTSPDGKQDILWYSTSATGASQLWDFNADGSVTKTTFGSVRGPGRLLLGDFAGDGITDVIRYQAGTASDSWFDFQTTSVAGRALNVNGTYRPLVARFDSDPITDILWYAQGSAPDSLWDFDGGGTRSTWELQINGSYTPAVGRFTSDGEADVIWYAPGPAPDVFWDFDNGGYTRQSLTVNGTYVPVACLCIQGLSPYTDVVWFGAGTRTDNAWRVDGNQPLTWTGFGTSIPGASVAGVGAFADGGTTEMLLIRH